MKKKQIKAVPKHGTVLNRLMQTVTAGYVMFLIIAIPLFYHDRYFDIGNFKNSMFYKGSLLMLAGISLIGLVALISLLIQQGGWVRLLEKQKTVIMGLSLLDMFMLTYTVISFASYVFSSYRENALWGCGGWRMGFVAQLIFVMIYFLVSRCWNTEWMNLFLWVNFLTSGTVFLFAVLHRFTIDPLGLYEGIDAYNFIEFLTTVGQATWYSSYLCTMLPIGVMLFWYVEKGRDRIPLGIYCFLGFATLVTQNSDSAFIALAILLVTLFTQAFTSSRTWRRFLEVLLLCLSAMKLVGLLQMVFPERVVPLEPLSLFCSQSNVTWILLTATVIIYALTGNLTIQKFMPVQKLILYLLVLMVPVIILLIVLTTTGHLPDCLSFLNEISYFHFDDDWGNARGFTWKLSARMYSDFSIREKLLGCGPDVYSEYMKAHYMEEMAGRFGTSVLPNAHNEWFNALICEGLLGFLTYTGLFITAAVSLWKEKRFLCKAFAVCVLCYMGHNLFCYQQVMCTPFVFLIMGLGTGLSKNVE